MWESTTTSRHSAVDARWYSIAVYIKIRLLRTVIATLIVFVLPFAVTNRNRPPGLPIEVRDKFLDEEDRLQIPGSDANREYMTQVHEKQLAETGNPYTNKPLNQKVTLRRYNQEWFYAAINQRC